jgi:peptidoglycan/LPS O-acetylase OafA/YrhL
LPKPKGLRPLFSCLICRIEERKAGSFDGSLRIKKSGVHVRSSSGQYQIGLDHLRAVAILMVFCWHFIHSGNIIPLDGSNTVFPVLAPFANGYMGVSLFMALSGYLYAGITDGKRLHYGAFLKNRVWRLLPLLTLAILLAYVQSKIMGRDLRMAPRLLLGWLAPSLPAGGWSVTVEFHFYLVLPLLLWLQLKSNLILPALVLVAVACRAVMIIQGMDAEYFSYYTMVGRIDQFLLGMLAYRARHALKGQHVVWLVGAAAFVAYASWLDHLGSIFNAKHDFSWLWLVSGTMEGAFFAMSVAWYAESFSFSNAGVSRFVAMIGRSSYSMYLLHGFVVFLAARWIHQHVVSLHEPHLAMLASLMTFLALVPMALLSYRWIELPFLRRRMIYAEPLFDRSAAFANEARLVSKDEARAA